MTGDEIFMGEALAEAQLAAEAGEVPVGAVAVWHGQIIARARNRVEAGKDATCHAEVELLKQCAAFRGDWRMEDVEIYVTKEPCAMCAGAMVNARVRRVIFGLSDPRSGAAGGALDVTGFPGMLHQVEVKTGVLADECGRIMKQFFQSVREKKKN